MIVLPFVTPPIRYILPSHILGDNDIDTPERKNRRMTQLAEVVYDNVSGLTGYGMVLKVRTPDVLLF